MKKHIVSIIALAMLIFVALACNASFTTASISSLNFGKNDTATPPTTTFDVGEKVFAVANVAGSMSKQKLKFRVTFENVQGKGKGEEAFKKDLDFEGSAPAILTLTLPFPGEYKVEATLQDEDGKEIDKKSGTITVKGSMPTAPPAQNDAKKDGEVDDDK